LTAEIYIDGWRKKKKKCTGLPMFRQNALVPVSFGGALDAQLFHFRLHRIKNKKPASDDSV